VAVFHLMTHAFFKALLFLGAGSVIIGMHHDQDIRNMGGLRKYMPITWITSLLGSLALIGTPFFSGFYSKDSIIEAVHADPYLGRRLRQLRGAGGVFVTAFYSFRMYFLVFHGEERFGKAHAHDHAHHAPAAGHDDPTRTTPTRTTKKRKTITATTAWSRVRSRTSRHSLVVTLPLVLLAIPSVIIGFLTIGPMLFGDFFKRRHLRGREPQGDGRTGRRVPRCYGHGDPRR
jgi:NADH-quinone oxidoreductase subunit L